jgi:serine/threonine-protein kinase SRPK3
VFAVFAENMPEVQAFPSLAAISETLFSFFPSDGMTAKEEKKREEGEEDEDEYGVGGYCLVSIGDVFDGRFKIIEKLGQGNFSEVWLVHDQDDRSYSALKIQKSANTFKEAAEDEIKLLECTRSAGEAMGGATETNVCEMKAHFEIDGPNGKHMCMVFELLGDDLLALIQKHDYKGIPISTVQHITFQMCEAFAFLHEQCAIIHTDLKPENLLLKPAIDVLALDIKKVQAIRASSDTSPTRRKKLKKQIKRMKHRAKARERAVSNNSDSTGPVSPRSLNTKGWQGEGTRFPNVVLADFGSACWTTKHFQDDITTTEYRSPEVIIGTGYDTATDMWSLACLIFELITGDYLFDPTRGSTAFTKDQDHVARFVELLGPIPPELLKCKDRVQSSTARAPASAEGIREGAPLGASARARRRKASRQGVRVDEFFDSQGELKRFRELKTMGLQQTLQERYEMAESEACAVASFLLPMLAFDPTRRATARQCLEHPWLRRQYLEHKPKGTTKAEPARRPSLKKPNIHAKADSADTAVGLDAVIHASSSVACVATGRSSQPWHQVGKASSEERAVLSSIAVSSLSAAQSNNALGLTPIGKRRKKKVGGPGSIARSRAGLASPLVTAKKQAAGETKTQSASA